ncbi:hypothetical protein THOM_2436 [Trachipleistophora hominis]|uniref:Uncharacterized protein n=1 Tax=Trachipleistophora hominis TaxID=72359 RepID=L7JTL5_TRAHO|nr:hypothetical protein THOM_2436 [Trachipleistophora hominis]
MMPKSTLILLVCYCLLELRGMGQQGNKTNSIDSSDAYSVLTNSERADSPLSVRRKNDNGGPMSLIWRAIEYALSPDSKLGTVAEFVWMKGSGLIELAVRICEPILGPGETVFENIRWLLVEVFTSIMGKPCDTVESLSNPGRDFIKELNRILQSKDIKETAEFTTDMNEVKAKQEKMGRFITDSEMLGSWAGLCMNSWADRERWNILDSRCVIWVCRHLRKFKEGVLEPIVYYLRTWNVALAFYSVLFLCHLWKMYNKTVRRLEKVVVVNKLVDDDNNDL